jgi:hypothetical protein
MHDINLRIIRDNVRVEWEYIGEGLNGEYNENDPEDAELLRFRVTKRDSADNEWTDVDDGSYCANMPLNTPDPVLLQALEIIMDNVYENVTTGLSIKKIGERLSHIDESLNIPPKDGGAVQFVFMGNTFQPLRDLTVIESGFENIEKRTNGFRNPIMIDGYTHKDFYEAAEANKAVADLFLMNGTYIVLPHNNGLLKYDETLRLYKDHLTYFTACCGKIVDSHKASEKAGYIVKGTVAHTGDTYCPRCKRDVTKTGEVKKTPRNDDIDKNEGWGYELVSKQRY